MTLNSILCLLLPVVVGLSIIESSPTAPNEYCTVKTQNGEVRGKLNLTLFDQKPFYSFRGIPFAQPPVGDLRFKAPVPVNNWVEMKDVTEEGPTCVQRIPHTKMVIGQEDCLCVNVYIPVSPSAEKLPVMFYIHGGGFQTGTQNDYGPDFLLNHDVIYVTTNYRLGVFGFMSLGTDEYSGNMGLKDQSLALKWVSDNIEAFGGDKERITVFGESAGSGSVQYHTISPRSRDLFQRAIMQSGSVLNPWALYSQRDHLDIMSEFGAKFGDTDGEYDKLIEYLKQASAETLLLELIDEIYQPGTDRKKCDIWWTPVIEEPSAVDAFITENPANELLRQSTTNIDTMMGFCSAEMFALALPDFLNPAGLAGFNKSLELQLPKKNLKYDYDSEEYQEIAADIRKFYFPTNPVIGAETLIELNQLLSDVWFVYGVVESAKQQETHSTGKTYLYKFSIESSDLNWVNELVGVNLPEHNLNGAAHGDDLLYVFNLSFGDKHVDYTKFDEASLELKTIRLMSKLWTNFAKYGTPTLPDDPVQFKPIENGVLNYLDITNDGLVPGVNPTEVSSKFWDDIYGTYANAFTSRTCRK